MKRIEIDDTKYDIKMVKSEINGMDNMHIYITPKDGFHCYICKKKIKQNHRYDWNIINDKKQGDVLVCKQCKEIYYTVKVFEKEYGHGIMTDTLFKHKTKNGTKHYRKPPMVKVVEIRKVLNERKQ